MQIDYALISRLEELARLELSEAEKEQLSKDLNDILAMVEKLRELDTRGVEPLVYLTEALNDRRPDRVGEEVPVEAALRNAPEHEGPFFKVPKVIDL